MQGDFERYLAAKATVDDRALDRRVLARFRDSLAAQSNPQVLEAGAGTAAFCRRLLSWDAPPDCRYVAVDTDADLLATARERILADATAAGFEASVDDGDAALQVGDVSHSVVATIQLRGPARIDVALVAADAVDIAAAGAWDALVAQAFVDLLTPDDVARLVSGVVPGGCVYLPITFDGGTAFVPAHSADTAILDAYHASMRPDGSERLGPSAGRDLLTLLPELGVVVEAVGGSDWAVVPSGGSYPADESYFLTVVLDTVADTVRGACPDETVDAWYDARTRQHASGELRFVARNLDLYGRVD